MIVTSSAGNRNLDETGVLRNRDPVPNLGCFPSKVGYTVPLTSQPKSRKPVKEDCLLSSTDNISAFARTQRFSPAQSFRSINSDGSGEFSQVTVHTEGKEKLALAALTDNTIEVEYWDVNWQHDGCYYPVNNGDTVEMEGASQAAVWLEHVVVCACRERPVRFTGTHHPLNGTKSSKAGRTTLGSCHGFRGTSA